MESPAPPIAGSVAEDAVGEADADPLAALRHELARQELDGFFVPRADAFQGEYVPACAQRLAWLSGFTGSAGMAVVLAGTAAVFVDGRYTLQAREETDPALWQLRHVSETSPVEWVTRTAAAGSRIGFDPWLHTLAWEEQTRPVLLRAGMELVACPLNPVDAVWSRQPPPPQEPVEEHPLRFAGESSHAKRMALAETLARRQVVAAVIAQPDSLAWLLNMRGQDAPCLPVALCFGLLHADGRVTLFIAEERVPDDLQTAWGDAVRREPPEAFGPALERLGRGQRVSLDPTTTAAWIGHRLLAAGATLERGPDPCALPKACKNDTELQGARAAHHRDGVAMVRFLAWLDQRHKTRTWPWEAEAAERLLAFRAEGALFRGPSFETISAAGPHAAIVHYRVTPASNQPLQPGSLYLVDSGAHYRDGTTDITRTIPLGEPEPAMRAAFTRVLKGHIGLAAARFPPGTRGSQLDALARAPLWAAGLDYDHGTSHGVGSYLSVHEGPQRISKLPGGEALQPGMILSNEPGYYKTGAWGIRIENLQAVVVIPPAPVAAVAAVDPAEARPMLGFETLTCVPMARTLVDPDLLTPPEREWLNVYHQWVLTCLAPDLDPETRLWLEDATRPL